MGKFRTVTNPIATLIESDGTVKRLSASGLTWDRATNGSGFETFDTIATGPSSRARLGFFNAGELLLEANTMVVLKGSLAQVRLAFVQGGGRLRVERGKREQVQVALQESARASIQVTEVEKIDRVPLTEKKFAASEQFGEQLASLAMIEETSIRRPGAILKTDGEVIERVEMPQTPQLETPTDQARVELRAGASIPLSWTVEDPSLAPQGYEVVVESAPTDGNTPLGKRKVYKVSGFRWMLDRSQLTPGEYRWSVRSFTKNGRPSPLAPFRTLTVSVPDAQSTIQRPKTLPVKVD